MDTAKKKLEAFDMMRAQYDKYRVVYYSVRNMGLIVHMHINKASILNDYSEELEEGAEFEHMVDKAIDKAVDEIFETGGHYANVR